MKLLGYRTFTEQFYSELFFYLLEMYFCVTYTTRNQCLFLWFQVQKLRMRQIYMKNVFSINLLKACSLLRDVKKYRCASMIPYFNFLKSQVTMNKDFSTSMINDLCPREKHKKDFNWSRNVTTTTPFSKEYFLFDSHLIHFNLVSWLLFSTQKKDIVIATHLHIVLWENKLGRIKHR